MKIRWWLLRIVARSMGLKVGVQGWHKGDCLRLVVLSANDQATLEALSLIAKVYTEDTGQMQGHRRHSEWVAFTGVSGRAERAKERQRQRRIRCGRYVYKPQHPRFPAGLRGLHSRGAAEAVARHGIDRPAV